MGTLLILLLTIQEAHRRFVLWAVSLLGLLFLTLYGFGMWLVQHDATKSGDLRAGDLFEAGDFLLLAGLYAVYFLVVMLGILLAVDSLSGEIASGTLQTVAARPVERWEIVTGKWLGLAGMLALFAAAMSTSVIAMGRLAMGYYPANPLQGVALIALAGVVALTLALLGGTRLSTLTNGVVVFMIYGLAFVGGWIEQFGAFLQNTTAVSLGIAISLAMPAEAMWKRAAYLMEPPILRQLGVHPFAAISAPSGAMVVYTALYVAAVLATAIVLFARRDL